MDSRSRSLLQEEQVHFIGFRTLKASFICPNDKIGFIGRYVLATLKKEYPLYKVYALTRHPTVTKDNSDNIEYVKGGIKDNFLFWQLT